MSWTGAYIYKTSGDRCHETKIQNGRIAKCVAHPAGPPGLQCAHRRLFSRHMHLFGCPSTCSDISLSSASQSSRGKSREGGRVRSVQRQSGRFGKPNPGIGGTRCWRISRKNKRGEWRRGISRKFDPAGSAHRGFHEERGRGWRTSDGCPPRIPQRKTGAS